MKNRKRVGAGAALSRALLVCACLLSAAVPLAAFALAASEAGDGAYLAATNTYYINQDTGVTDDGGSRNAAIGEGMCRSVIYEKALVEIDGGKVYTTVRVQLVSNMGAIKFTVQQTKGDPSSYVSVSPRIVSEDAGADTADYRFEIPSVTSYIGCSTYVTPMGRDVKFYMNLSDSLTEGSGDFVVSVKPKAQTAETETPAPPAPPPAAQPQTAETPAAKNPSTEETPALPGADTAQETPAPQGEDTAANAAAGEPAGEPADDAAAPETPESGDAGTAADGAAVPEDRAAQGVSSETGAEPENGAAEAETETAPAASERAESGGFRAGLVIAVAAVLVLIAITAAVFFRKKKRASD
jgi:hypothetical protein